MIKSGHLVTPLGADLGADRAVSFYNNNIQILEPNVNQNYRTVNHWSYLKAAPDYTPASKFRTGQPEVLDTNLLVLGLLKPDGTLWSTLGANQATIDFRF